MQKKLSCKIVRKNVQTIKAKCDLNERSHDYWSSLKVEAATHHGKSEEESKKERGRGREGGSRSSCERIWKGGQRAKKRRGEEFQEKVLVGGSG